MTRKLFALFVFAVGVACLGLTLYTLLPGEPEVVEAADHTDAPLATSEAMLDITDVYAFRPTGTDNLCVAICVNPVTGTPTGNLFDNNGIYEAYIDNTGDNVADATARITFSGTAPQQFTITGLTSTPITGDVSTGATPNVVTSMGVSAFAGLRDDPFFFDLVGFQDFTTMLYNPDNGLRLTATNGSPADTFAGGNVCAIVFEFPITAVNGSPTNPNTGTIRAWVKTYRQN